MFRTALIAVLYASLTGPALAADGELFRGFGTTQPDRPAVPAVPATADQGQPRQATSRPDEPAWNPTSRPDFDGLPAVIKALTKDFFDPKTDEWRREELTAPLKNKTMRVTMSLSSSKPSLAYLTSEIGLTRSSKIKVGINCQVPAELSQSLRNTPTGKDVTVVGRVIGVSAGSNSLVLWMRLLHIAQSTR